METAGGLTERANPWVERLLAMRMKAADVVPEGWKTREQLQVIWQCRKAQAGRELGRLMEAGEVERKPFNLVVKDGVVKPIPHYRLK